MPKDRPTATLLTCALTWQRRSVLTSRLCPLPWHLTVTTMLAPVLHQTQALMGHHAGLPLWPPLSSVSHLLPRPHYVLGMQMLLVNLTWAHSGTRGNGVTGPMEGNGDKEERSKADLKVTPLHTCNIGNLLPLSVRGMWPHESASLPSCPFFMR